MAVKYRANYNSIKEFEIIKETEKQVVYKNERGAENREAKISDWCSWHNTFEEAREYIIQKEMKSIEQLLSRIKYHNEVIDKIKSF